jgi:hypothetical protein
MLADERPRSGSMHHLGSIDFRQHVARLDLRPNIKIPLLEVTAGLRKDG